MKKWDGGRARKTSEMYNFCWENNTPGDSIIAWKSRLPIKTRKKLLFNFVLGK